MSLGSHDLSQEVLTISDRFSSLGERLLNAARQLQSPGSPPAEGLIEELGHARLEFIGVRDRTRERAEALYIALPSAETLDTIQGLTAVLDLVTESEARQSQAEEVRRRALTVLDRVLGLRHTADPEFAPLRTCQDQARALRGAVASGVWTTLPPEAEALSNGEHPFANLVALVAERDLLHDDHWATLHDSIGAVFGRSLAAAAARAKLVPSPDQASLEDAGRGDAELVGSGERDHGAVTPNTH